jgi:hypothetical protein
MHWNRLIPVTGAVTIATVFTAPAAAAAQQSAAATVGGSVAMPVVIATIAFLAVGSALARTAWRRRAARVTEQD